MAIEAVFPLGKMIPGANRAGSRDRFFLITGNK
jgi:hypothetical protein